MSKIQKTESEIKEALRSGALLFYYQPKISLASGKVTGAEALIRWREKDGGIVPPDEFIPFAEASGLITDITTAMFPILVEDINKMKETRRDISISFNISAKDLYSDELLNTIKDTLETEQISKNNLQLEITETAIVDNSSRIEESLDNLFNLGVQIVMDDYGVGYSSVDLLSRIPFSAIKLDQGIIGRMASSSKNALITRAIILMAADLKIKTIAEGVESQAAYNYLLSLGCDEAQGYWMSQPLTLDDFIELCRSEKRWFGSPYGQIFSIHLHHVQTRKTVMDTLFCLTSTPPEERHALPLPDLSVVHTDSIVDGWLAETGRVLGLKVDEKEMREHRLKLHEISQELVKVSTERKDEARMNKLFQEMSEHTQSIFRVMREIEEKIITEIFAQNIAKISPAKKSSKK